jgi:hypothetical protein
MEDMGSHTFKLLYVEVVQSLAFDVTLTLLLALRS